MWEYDRFEFKCKSISELIDNLNQVGRDNWEIIYYIETVPEKFGDKWEIIIVVKRLKPV